MFSHTAKRPYLIAHWCSLTRPLWCNDNSLICRLNDSHRIFDMFPNVQPILHLGLFHSRTWKIDHIQLLVFHKSLVSSNGWIGKSKNRKNGTFAIEVCLYTERLCNWIEAHYFSDCVCFFVPSAFDHNLAVCHSPYTFVLAIFNGTVKWIPCIWSGHDLFRIFRRNRKWMFWILPPVNAIHNDSLQKNSIWPNLVERPCDSKR